MELPLTMLKPLPDCVGELARVGPGDEPGTLMEAVVARGPDAVGPLAAAINTNEVAPLHVLRALVRVLPAVKCAAPDRLPETVQALLAGASKHGHCEHQGGKEVLQALRDGALPPGAVIPNLVESLEAASKSDDSGIAAWGSVVGEIFSGNAEASAPYAERIGTLYASAPQYVVRHAAYHVLLAMGEFAAAAEGFVLTVLQTAEDFERNGAAEIAGNIGSAPLIAELEKMAATTNYHLLFSVLQALAKNNRWEEKYTRRLISTRFEAAKFPDQIAKIQAVVMAAGTLMFKSLLKVLGDGKADEKALAARWMKDVARAYRKQTLAQTWVRDNQESLCAFLTDPDEQVARCIAGVLGYCLTFSQPWYESGRVRSDVLLGPAKLSSWILAKIIERSEEQEDGFKLFARLLRSKRTHLRRLAIFAYGWMPAGTLPSTELSRLDGALDDRSTLNSLYAALACLHHNRSFASAYIRLGELFAAHPNNKQIAAAIEKAVKVESLC